MVLRGWRQKPVSPSVVPFRSFSSLNLQQVPSCDFYLYSPSGSSSSEPQTTAQKGNHLLYITGSYWAMESCLLTINSSSSIQKSQEENIWWRHLCVFHVFFPSFPFSPSVFWISHKPWSDLVVMLVLWLYREMLCFNGWANCTLPTKMGNKELPGCFQAKEARQEAVPFHEGLSQQGKKLQKDRLNTGSWSDKSFFFIQTHSPSTEWTVSII